MKKIKNNGACVPNMVLGFLGSSDTQAPYSFSFLFSSFFFFFFPRSFSASILSFSSFFLLLFLLSPIILMLSLLELSLSLDFAQTQTQTHMPQAPLSNQWVSLFGIFFGGFLCIWCCWLAVVRWRAWVCGDQRGGGLSLWIGMVEGVGLWWSASVVEFWWWHRSEFGSVDDGLHDCSVAGLVMVGG